MGFVRDDEVEVGGRKVALVFVVEEQRLDGGDDDFRLPPVVAVFLVDDGFEIVLKVFDEGFRSLVFQFETIHEEENATGIRRAEEELDDGGSGEGLAGAGRHLKQEAVLAVLDGLDQGTEGAKLIGTEEAEFVSLDENLTFNFTDPCGFRGVGRPLSQDHVVLGDAFCDDPCAVRNNLRSTRHGLWCGECGDDIGISPFQVPEIMEVAVGQDDVAAVLGPAVFPRLFLADEWIFVLSLGLEHDQGEALFAEQQEINEALGGFLEVLTERVEVLDLQRDARLKLDIGRAFRVSKEAPARVFQQLVDFDAGGGFFHGVNRAEETLRITGTPFFWNSF